MQLDKEIKTIGSDELLRYSTWAFIKSDLTSFIKWLAMVLSLVPAIIYAYKFLNNIKKYIPEGRE